jgi:hypothetical protein
MTQRIVFKNSDGSVGIIIPTPEALRTMTIEQIAEKDVPQGLEWRITSANNIPSDRTFRAAWTDNLPTPTVDVDMPKARDIKMVEIRKLRNEKLEELDIETLKGNNVQAEKQVLRDLPDNIDLEQFTTPDELKEYIPPELS